MSDHSVTIASCLEQFRQGHGDEAFHALLELDQAALPALSEAFQASTDTSTRAFLLNVIWQHRQPSAIPLLDAALFDGEPEVWREAMDGLVTLAGQESLHALRRAKQRHFTSDCNRHEFHVWLDEAIDQAERQTSS